MIKYSLICNNGHVFEGWFSSGTAFDSQKGQGLLTCPLCASREVKKDLMTPLISAERKKSVDTLPRVPGTDSVLATNTSVSSEISEAITKIRELRNRIQANSEDVGNRFSEEARKIYYGEVEKRGIYGQARPEDIKELVEEGISVIPLPILPEDRN